MSLVLAPVGMALVCLGIDDWDHFHRVQTVALVAASLGLLAVIGRLMFTFKEYLALLSLTRVESLSDALTGLATVARWCADLDDYFRPADDESSVLLLFDLDGFKSYNDTLRSSGGRRLAPASRGAAPSRWAHAARSIGSAATSSASSSGLERQSAVGTSSLRTASLLESGDGFTISSSVGYVAPPRGGGGHPRRAAARRSPDVRGQGARRPRR